MEFQPDYQNLVKAARNIEVARIPLYEHKIDPKVMERVTGKNLPTTTTVTTGIWMSSSAATAVSTGIWDMIPYPLKN